MIKYILVILLMLISNTGMLQADSLDVSTKNNIVAGATAAAADVKTAFDNIATWSTNIADDNIKSGAAIAAAKISGTAVTLSGSQTISGDKTITGALQGGSPLIFEGATADDFELTLAVPDPTADVTYTLQGSASVSSTIKSWQNAGTADVSIVFEGATADDFETTLTVTDPTADRTFTIPDSDLNLSEQSIKGWINMNGTGTIAINDHYNVSGIVDDGTGDYTITWDTDFASANYAIGGAALVPSAASFAQVHIDDTGKLATTAASVLLVNQSNSATDCQIVTVIAIGDQ